jgi:hypothetical protein
MTNSTIPAWQSVLRWLALIPIAIIAYILAYTVFFYLSRWNLRLITSSPEAFAPLFGLPAQRERSG